MWPRTEDLVRPPSSGEALMLKGERVALVSAYSEALPADVLAQLHAKLKPMRPLLCLPQHADQWDKVQYVLITYTEKSRDTDYDLWKWHLEICQAPCYVPVLHEGNQMEMSMALSEVQGRDPGQAVTQIQGQLWCPGHRQSRA